MDERNDDLFCKWNHETDIIKILFSDKIKDLKEQLEILEIGQTNPNAENIYENEKAIALAKTEIGSLNGILGVYLSKMQDRKRAWIQEKQKERRQLIEQVAILLQYKKIIAITQIPEITCSLRAGTNGAIKLNERELILLNWLNELINPRINFGESRRARNKKLQISVERGMKIVKNSSVSVIGYRTGSEIKCFLDRISNCQLFSNMPSWLENKIFIQQMSAIAPARATRNSSSCFVIDNESNCTSPNERGDAQAENS